jgi:putative sigma-54 modulation protein
MIANVEITGVGSYSPDELTKKYVRRKIGMLDRKLPKHARQSAWAEAKLAQVNRDKGNKYEVEVILHVPNKLIAAHDSTMNILAATDIVEAKLTNQLRKYKEDSIPHVGQRKLLDRFKRSYAREM